MQDISAVKVLHSLSSLVDQGKLVGMGSSITLEICQDVAVFHCC